MTLRGRRGLLQVAAALFVAVLALMYALDDPVQAVSIVFVVPIALCALALGVRGGIAGALTATVLLVVWVVSNDHELGVAGWCSRLVAFGTIGVVVGRYENLAREFEARRLGERYAAEVHDGVVQQLVVARYQLQAGDAAPAGASVDAALGAAKQIISDRMADVRPGDLRLEWREKDGGAPPPSRQDAP